MNANYRRTPPADPVFPARFLVLLALSVFVASLLLSSVYVTIIDQSVTAWGSAVGSILLFLLAVLGLIPAGSGLSALARPTKRLVRWAAADFTRAIMAVVALSLGAGAAIKFGPLSVHAATVRCNDIKKVGWLTWYEGSSPHIDDCDDTRPIRIWDFTRTKNESLCTLQCMPGKYAGLLACIEKTQPDVVAVCDINRFGDNPQTCTDVDDYCGRAARIVDRRNAERLRPQPSLAPPVGRPPEPSDSIASQLSCREELFGDPIEENDFDRACPDVSGKSTSATTALQNSLKNNFCSGGPPNRLSFADIVGLQLKAEDVIDVRHPTPPPQRDQLSRIGEGRLVQLMAHIVDARYANVYGESVNCRMKGRLNNDIHLVLAETPVADLCSTMIGEISPHFRPSWLSPDLLSSLRSPVRVTGQLFYDANHSPCGGAAAPRSHGLASWEIHPVYDIEVCRHPERECRVEDDADWTPLRQ